jgi:hypothetical protein
MNDKKTTLIIFAVMITFVGFGFAQEVLASLIFSWSCTGGDLDNPNIAQPTFTAPQVSENTNYVCTLTVTESTTGLSDSDTMNVLVIDTAEKPDQPVGRELWDHCSVQGLSVPVFQWTYSDSGGNPQSVSRVKIYGETTLDTGELSCPSTCTSYAPSYGWISDNLVWGKTYEWQVRVKNDQGVWSEWSDLDSFTMPLHAYPWPDFIHTPPNPGTGEEVMFIDTSKCYHTSGNTKYPCHIGEEAIQYQWDFDYIPEEGFTIDSTNKGITTTVYSDPGSHEVRLKIIDSTLSPAGSCTGKGDSPVGSTLRLPEWKEIPPVSWLKNLFANLSEFVKF